MIDWIANLSDISDRYDAVFCDVWGCIHDGERIFPGAVAALARFGRKGGTVVLLTNAPRPWREVKRQLSALGTPRDSWHLIVTSGDAARDALLEHRAGRDVFHIGPERDLPFFAGESGVGSPSRRVNRVSFERAEGIVCTGLFDDETETPEDYRDLLGRARDSGMTLLCANPDEMIYRGPRKVYCAGAIARLYRQLGGEVLQFGKPRSAIYRLARNRLAEARGRDVPDERILCIGDGPQTDLSGAVRESLSCLFVTGGLAAEDIGQLGPPGPQTLARHLGQLGIACPRYAIEELR